MLIIKIEKQKITRVHEGFIKVVDYMKKGKMKGENIILFDGECSFCSFWVKYVIKRDKKDVFRFASLQSEIGKKLLSQHKINPTIDAVVLIANNSYHTKSTAALRVLKTLGGLKSIFYFFIITPPFIRDFFYDLVAKYRHLLFTNKSCELPEDKNVTHKFLM